MKTLVSVFAVLVSAFAASVAHAQSLVITCPGTLEVQSVSAYQGWTPQGSVEISFKSASIKNVGGVPSMYCIYENGLQLMQRVGDNRRCVARGIQFFCDPIGNNAAGTRTLDGRGTLQFFYNQTVDLDRGYVGQDQGADFRSSPVLLEAGRESYFTGILDRGRLSDCEAYVGAVPYILLRDLRRGSRFCVRTDEGRWSSVLVDGLGDNSMTIIYRTF